MGIFPKIIHRLILNKLTKKKKRVNDIKKKIVWEREREREREREQTIKERKKEEDKIKVRDTCQNVTALGQKKK